MGSGVAKVLYEKYPDVKRLYHKHTPKSGEGVNMLGRVSNVVIGNDRVIINCYTQEFYGYDGRKYVSYDAVYDVFSRMVTQGIKEIAIPKIGAGLAGGNWEVISRIIDDATGDDLDVYVYYLED